MSEFEKSWTTPWNSEMYVSRVEDHISKSCQKIPTCDCVHVCWPLFCFWRICVGSRGEKKNNVALPNSQERIKFWTLYIDILYGPLPASTAIYSTIFVGPLHIRALHSVPSPCRSVCSLLYLMIYNTLNFTGYRLSLCKPLWHLQ